MQRLGITPGFHEGSRGTEESAPGPAVGSKPRFRSSPKQWHKGINRSNGNFLDFRESIRHEATVKAAK